MTQRCWMIALFLSSAAHAEDLVSRLAWLPSDTHTISGSPPERAPFLGAIRTRIGWTPEWLIAHDDRKHVEELIAELGRRHPHPTLDPLLPRIDVKSPFWGVTDLDYGSKTVGVPSAGARLWIAEQRFLATVLFSTHAEALRAVASLKQKVARAELSPNLREALNALAPRVAGREVTIDYSKLFTMNTLQEAAKALGVDLSPRN